MEEEQEERELLWQEIREHAQDLHQEAKRRVEAIQKLRHLRPQDQTALSGFVHAQRQTEQLLQKLQLYSSLAEWEEEESELANMAQANGDVGVAEELEKQLDTLRLQLQKVEQERDNLDMEMWTLRTQQELHEDEQLEWSKQKQELEERLRTLEKEETAAKLALESSERVPASDVLTEEERSAWKQEKQQLQLRLQQLQTEEAAQKQELVQQLETLKQEWETATEQLRQKLTQDGVERELRHVEQEQEWQHKNSTLQQELARLQLQVEELQEKRNQEEALRQEQEETWHTSLQQLQHQLQQQESEKEGGQQQLEEECAGLSSQLQQLENRLQQSQDAAASLQTEKESLSTQLQDTEERLQDSLREHQQLQQQLQSAVKERDSLQAAALLESGEWAELQTQLQQELRLLDGEVKQEREMVLQLRSELQQAQQQLEEEEKSKLEKLREAAREQEQLQQRLLSSEASVAQLQQRIQKLEGEQDAVLQEAEDALKRSQELEQLQQQVTTLQQQLLQEQTLHKHHQSAFGAHKLSVTRLDQQLASATQQLQQKEERLTQLQEKLTHYKQSLQQLKQRLQESEERAHSVSSAAAAAQQEVSTQMQQLQQSLAQEEERASRSSQLLASLSRSASIADTLQLLSRGWAVIKPRERRRALFFPLLLPPKSSAPNEDSITTTTTDLYFKLELLEVLAFSFHYSEAVLLGDSSYLLLSAEPEKAEDRPHYAHARVLLAVYILSVEPLLQQLCSLFPHCSLSQQQLLLQRLESFVERVTQPVLTQPFQKGEQEEKRLLYFSDRRESETLLSHTSVSLLTFLAQLSEAARESSFEKELQPAPALRELEARLQTGNHWFQLSLLERVREVLQPVPELAAQYPTLQALQDGSLLQSEASSCERRQSEAQKLLNQLQSAVQSNNAILWKLTFLKFQSLCKAKPAPELDAQQLQTVLLAVQRSHIPSQPFSLLVQQLRRR